MSSRGTAESLSELGSDSQRTGNAQGLVSRAPPPGPDAALSVDGKILLSKTELQTSHSS